MRGRSTGGAPPAGTVPSSIAASGSAAPADPAVVAAVLDVVNRSVEQNHLRAVLVKVTKGDGTVVEQAVGESMTGAPATTDVHFRNGAVAVSYMSTPLLILVDEGRARLDDKVSTWLHDLPHADRVTLGRLAQMTSGYVDDEQTPELTAANYADPYMHVILGQVLEKITGQPLDQALREKVLDPLGLDKTPGNDGTPAIPDPVLHAFPSERRPTLKVPPHIPFDEESTWWHPSWTLAQGAIRTANLDDLISTARGIGSGRLLTPESYAKFTTNDLRGKTSAVPSCPACVEQRIGHTFDPTTVAYPNAADQLWREVAPPSCRPIRRRSRKADPDVTGVRTHSDFSRWSSRSERRQRGVRRGPALPSGCWRRLAAGGHPAGPAAHPLRDGDPGRRVLLRPAPHPRRRGRPPLPAEYWVCRPGGCTPPSTVRPCSSHPAADRPTSTGPGSLETPMEKT